MTWIDLSRSDNLLMEIGDSSSVIHKSDKHYGYGFAHSLYQPKEYANKVLGRSDDTDTEAVDSVPPKPTADDVLSGLQEQARQHDQAHFQTLLGIGSVAAKAP